jgi:hypothetical protein
LELAPLQIWLPSNDTMDFAITASLLLNIAVLVPVCYSFVNNADWVRSSYGEQTAEQSILLCVYVAILILSTVLLVFRDPRAVSVLLIVQILYKAMTPVAVGSLSNPVVVSNLVIAAVHGFTLFIIWRTIGNPFTAPMS